MRNVSMFAAPRASVSTSWSESMYLRARPSTLRTPGGHRPTSATFGRVTSCTVPSVMSASWSVTSPLGDTDFTYACVR